MQPVIHSGDEIETLQNQIIRMVDRIRNLLYDIQCAEQTRHKLEFQILQTRSIRISAQYAQHHPLYGLCAERGEYRNRR